MATRYEDMVLKSYEVHWAYNVAAASFSWLLLAGFIVLPGTFKSLDLPRDDSQASRAARELARRVPLLCLSSICCAVGLLGTIWLWRKFRRNYVWLLGHLFEPGLLNSVSGLLTVIVGVYASRDGNWSVTAKAMVGIVVLALSYMLMALLVYRYSLRKIGN